MDCQSCTKSYADARNELRCRLSGLLSTPALAQDCKQYEREPGSDDYIEINLCSGCTGRGD